jgi:hypothetical protein
MRCYIVHGVVYYCRVNIDIYRLPSVVRLICQPCKGDYSIAAVGRSRFATTGMNGQWTAMLN